MYIYKEKMSVKEAKQGITKHISDGYNREQNIISEALASAQEDGIIFIDEIDKITSPSDSLKTANNPSAEGVQRDLLPLIEGTVISTKHGDVNTDHMLFIACGSFSEARPSDLIAELQGRLPVRVTLRPLSKHDFIRILTEPKNNLIIQHKALLKTEGVDLKFTDEAVEAIAEVADYLNLTVENTGARRLLTVLEKVLEDVSFNAPDLRVVKKEQVKNENEVEMSNENSEEIDNENDLNVFEEVEYIVDEELVRSKVLELSGSLDLRKHVL